MDVPLVPTVGCTSHLFHKNKSYPQCFLQIHRHSLFWSASFFLKFLLTLIIILSSIRYRFLKTFQTKLFNIFPVFSIILCVSLTSSLLNLSIPAFQHLIVRFLAFDKICSVRHANFSFPAINVCINTCS